MTRRNSKQAQRARQKTPHPFMEPLPDASLWLHRVHPRFNGEPLESRMVKATLIRDGWFAAAHLNQLRDIDIDALQKWEKDLIRHLLQAVYAGMAVSLPLDDGAAP